MRMKCVQKRLVWDRVESLGNVGCTDRIKMRVPVMEHEKNGCLGAMTRSEAKLSIR